MFGVEIAVSVLHVVLADSDIKVCMKRLLEQEKK